MLCPHCQAECKETSRFCPKCGAKIAPPLEAPAEVKPSGKVCPDCQNLCTPDAKFCPKCGAKIAPPLEMPAEVKPSGKVCPDCQAPCKQDAKFCPKCGHRFAPANADLQSGEAATAAIQPGVDVPEQGQPLAQASPTMAASVDVASSGVSIQKSPVASDLHSTLPPAEAPASGSASKPSVQPVPAAQPKKGGAGIWIAMLVFALILAGVAAGAYYILVLKPAKASSPDAIASAVEASKPVEILHPSSGVASTPVAEMASVVTTDQASLPASAVKSVAASTVDANKGPQVLNDAEMKATLSEMKKNGPEPINCEDAQDILHEDYGVSSAQAAQLAKKGFPELCGAKSRKLAAKPVAAPSQDKSIDDVYNERAGIECNRGVVGVPCREELKRSLCSKRWTSNAVPGQSICLGSGK